MKKTGDHEDELRPKYDLRELKVVRTGPGRSGGTTVTLDEDVAKMFPTSASVNEALRLLLRMAKAPGRRSGAQ